MTMHQPMQVGATILEETQNAVRLVLEAAGRSPVNLRPESSLVDDLGLDSVMFIDLTLELEHAFRLAEFPMQRWIDAETRLASPHFTLESLARYVAGLSPSRDSSP